MLSSDRAAVEASDVRIRSLVAYNNLRIVQTRRWLNQGLYPALFVRCPQTALDLPLVHVGNFDETGRLAGSLMVPLVAVVLLTISPFALATFRALSIGPVILHELEIDVMRVCYLLRQPQLAGVDSARGLLLKVKLNRLPLHDRCAEHI